MTASNLVYGPQIPYVTLIPGGLLPGKAIVFKGMALTGKGKSFALNLCCGLLVDGGDHKDNVAFHFNPRFDENKVILNALVNNKWGPEERYDNPFKMGQAFEIRLLALTDIIKVAVNGRHFCDFRHRLALAEVKTLFVKGCIRLDFIQFEGDQSFSPYTASNMGQQQQQVFHPQQQQFPQQQAVFNPQQMQFQPQPQFQAQQQVFQPQAQAPYAASYSPLAYPTGSQPPPSSAGPAPIGVAPNFAAPSAPAGAAMSQPVPSSAPIFKPPVPYTVPLPNGLRFKQQIFITGTPKQNCERFQIDFSSKDDILLHFNPRFNEKVVVRNTLRKGKWEKEERTAPNFPFLAGGTFDLIVLCDSDGFKVAVNGQHFIHYAHRVPPAAIDSMSIGGGLTLQQIHVQ